MEISLFTLLTTSLSIGATIASVLLFLSPLKQVQQLKSLGSTNGQSAIPFLVMFVNCCLWTLYGIQMRLLVILIVNAIGVALTLYYIVVFFLISGKKDRIIILVSLLLSGVLISWATLYIQHFVGPYTDINLLPWVATAICIIMFAAPLVVAQKVISQRDSSFLNLQLSITGVINCIAWGGLGIIYQNLFLLVPNAIGLVLYILQILLIIIFPAKVHNDVITLKDVNELTALV